MPKFTLQQLFIVVTIVSMCCAAITFYIRYHVLEQLAPLLVVIVYFIPGALLGTLLFLPVKRPRLGMVLGIFAELLFIYFRGRF